MHVEAVAGYRFGAGRPHGRTELSRRRPRGTHPATRPAGSRQESRDPARPSPPPVRSRPFRTAQSRRPRPFHRGGPSRGNCDHGAVEARPLARTWSRSASTCIARSLTFAVVCCQSECLPVTRARYTLLPSSRKLPADPRASVRQLERAAVLGPVALFMGAREDPPHAGGQPESMWQHLKHEVSIGRPIAESAQGGKCERVRGVVSQIEPALDRQICAQSITESCLSGPDQSLDLAPRRRLEV